MSRNECDYCHGWRRKRIVKIASDTGGIYHGIDAGVEVELVTPEGHYKQHHYWEVEPLEGRFQGQIRNVCCIDMEPIELTKDEEAEVLARIQTSVQRVEP